MHCGEIVKWIPAVRRRRFTGVTAYFPTSILRYKSKGPLFPLPMLDQVGTLEDALRVIVEKWPESYRTAPAISICSIELHLGEVQVRKA
jgi:hypothetical protein